MLHRFRIKLLDFGITPKDENVGSIGGQYFMQE